MERFFRTQMLPFEGRTITAELLDEVERSLPGLYHEHFARFIIRGGQVTSRASLERFPDYIRDRFHVMTQVLTRLGPSIPDLELEIYLGDGFTGWLSDCPAPVFAFSKHQEIDLHALLLPDPITLQKSAEMRAQVAEGNALHPWDGKAEKAFWRGSTTGDWMTVAEFSKNVRFRLSQISVESPDFVDAGFTGFHPACEHELQSLAERMGYCRFWTSVKDHMRYKYLLLVDGFTSPWPRDFWQMYSNSVILKQQSPIIGWFSSQLQPNVHYIPVAHDLSDLIDTITMCRGNDGFMRTVSANANAFADTALSDDQIFRYMIEFLSYYSTFWR